MASTGKHYSDLYEKIGGVLCRLTRFYVDAGVTGEPRALHAAKETFGAGGILRGSD
jgi:hypothetical protein